MSDDNVAHHNNQSIKMAATLTIVPIAYNGVAYTSAGDGIPVLNIIRTRPASSGEIAAFPTAVTAVEFNDVNYASIKKSTYLTTTATATVIGSMG